MVITIYFEMNFCLTFCIELLFWTTLSLIIKLKTIHNLIKALQNIYLESDTNIAYEKTPLHRSFIRSKTADSVCY